MKTTRLPLVAAALLAVSPWSTMAQTVVTRPAPTASAAAPTKPAPRVLTPDEKRETATVPGDLRPEGPATPQLSIPLGKTADKPTSPTAKRGKTGSAAGGINDAVARCNAEVDDNERAKCRDRAAQQSRSR